MTSSNDRPAPWPNEDMTSADSDLKIGVAIGFYLFAAMLMLLSGSFHFLIGLATLLNDEFYTVKPGYDFSIDTTAWGWLQIIGSGVMMIAAIFLLVGATWARVVSVVVLGLSVLFSFYSIPYYPIWSVIIIVMNIGAIWAILAHGNLFSEEAGNAPFYDSEYQGH